MKNNQREYGWKIPNGSFQRCHRSIDYFFDTTGEKISDQIEYGEIDKHHSIDELKI